MIPPPLINRLAEMRENRVELLARIERAERRGDARTAASYVRELDSLDEAIRILGEHD